jgi:hypothetical protein
MNASIGNRQSLNEQASLLHPQTIDGIHMHGPQRGRHAGDDGGGDQDGGGYQDRASVGG